MYMENQLEAIKANLPFGYEKKIAREVGCSQGTVHNILNAKHASRSSFKVSVLSVAQRMASENLKAMQDIAETAKNISEYGAAG